MAEKSAPNWDGFLNFMYSEKVMDELVRELKSEGVLKSPYVEAAFRAIDRKDFVLPEYKSEAYGNYPLPIGEGQTISQPYTVAFMLDLLDPQPTDKILDVGSGSGWTAALLAHVVNQTKNQESGIMNHGAVYALERIPELCEFGKANVRKYDYLKKRVAEFLCRDGTLGLPEEAPFDKILASAAAFAEIPEEWRKQLKVGGKIVAPVGSSVMRYTKTPDGRWQEEEYPGFAFVPLVRGADSKQEPANSEPERKEWKHHKALFVFLGLSTILFSSAIYTTFAPLTLPSPKTRIEIQEGTGLRTIATLLKSSGIIRSQWAFVTYALISGSASQLKAGTYEFSGRMAMPEAIRLLVGGGQYPNERVITIPEGWNLRDIGFYFENSGMFQAEELWETAGFPAADYKNPGDLPRPLDFSKEFPFLGDKPKLAGLEGYLYPDTYRVFRNATLKSIIQKMLENFNKKLAPELRQEIKRQKKSVFEIITMASLVEKEVSDTDDRRMVAGILWKRLGNNIPLQVDASVNYITAKRKTPSAEDLAIDSPFNTYRYPGLPPGPIANPGIDAIRAAIFPRASQYLYYLSGSDGQTIFSPTLEDHNAAKAKYLR